MHTNQCVDLANRLAEGCRAGATGSHREGINQLRRKALSGLLFLTAISVALGAFGHGSEWAKHALPGLTGVDPEMVKLLKLVWYWVSGAMLVFGGLLLWSAWRLSRGDSTLAFVPWGVGFFYFIEGIYGAAALGPFFLIFAAQAMLLCVSAGALASLNALQDRKTAGVAEGV